MTEPSLAPRGRTAFDRFAERVSDLVSGAAFFTVCLIGVVVWIPTIWIFASVDTWQLVINTVTSVLAFLLIALLQNSERRTDRAAAQKMDTVAAALADLLEAGVADGLIDRARAERRVAQLREAVRIEEEI